MQRPKRRGLAVYTAGVPDNASDCVNIVLLQHETNIFRQPKVKNALYYETAVLIRIESQRIDIPKEMP